MKIVTIKDVAKAAKVSISTVSRVLNDRQDVDPETRARVLEMVKKLNYLRNRSASSLKQQNTAAVGVILRGRQNAFLTDLAEQVLDAGRETGFQFIMEIIDEKANQFITARHLYLEQKLQGVIFLGSSLASQEEEVRRLDLPQVHATVQAGHLHYPHISSVSVDNRQAGRTAIEKLIELGHRDVALLGYFAGENDSTGLRLHGARDALAAAGIAHDDDLYAECGFTLSSGYEGVRQILGRGKRFTALFAASDMMAIGAIKALADAGLNVPGNVSVIGFDGIEIGRYLTPALSTMRQPTQRIAEESVRLMRRLIQGQPAGHLLVECEYLPGGSVRAR